MSQKLLCEIEDSFQITDRGLVLAPGFSVPSKGTWKNFTTNIEIETNDGERKKLEANFWLSHFNIRDPNVPMDKRWRVVLNLPKAHKEEAPIGSKVYVSEDDYVKVMDN
jgi:hypothetical protein